MDYASADGLDRRPREHNALPEDMCGAQQYVALFRQQRTDVLARRRGQVDGDGVLGVSRRRLNALAIPLVSEPRVGLGVVCDPVRASTALLRDSGPRKQHAQIDENHVHRFVRAPFAATDGTRSVVGAGVLGIVPSRCVRTRKMCCVGRSAVRHLECRP